MNVGDSIDCENLQDYLADNLPELISFIDKEIQDQDVESLILIGLLRDVFVYRGFRPAVRAADSKTLDKYYAMVEDLLLTRDESLLEYAIEYVVPAVLSTDRWARETQLRAGPLLQAELDRDIYGPSWRTREGGFGDDNPAPPPRHLAVGVDLYGAWIYFHAFEASPEGGSAISHPFAKLPADSSAESVGGTVSGMFEEMLKYSVADPVHLVDGLMEFVGGTDWATFYAQSRSVSIAGYEGSFEARVWPRHKSQQADRIGNIQGKFLAVEDWRDPQSFGAVILTALAVSSTTDWIAPS